MQQMQSCFRVVQLENPVDAVFLEATARVHLLEMVRKVSAWSGSEGGQI